MRLSGKLPKIAGLLLRQLPAGRIQGDLIIRPFLDAPAGKDVRVRIRQQGLEARRRNEPDRFRTGVRVPQLPQTALIRRADRPGPRGRIRIGDPAVSVKGLRGGLHHRKGRPAAGQGVPLHMVRAGRIETVPIPADGIGRPAAAEALQLLHAALRRAVNALAGKAGVHRPAVLRKGIGPVCRQQERAAVQRQQGADAPRRQGLQHLLEALAGVPGVRLPGRLGGQLLQGQGGGHKAELHHGVVGKEVLRRAARPDGAVRHRGEQDGVQRRAALVLQLARRFGPVPQDAGHAGVVVPGQNVTRPREAAYALQIDIQRPLKTAFFRIDGVDRQRSAELPGRRAAVILKAVKGAGSAGCQFSVLIDVLVNGPGADGFSHLTGEGHGAAGVLRLQPAAPPGVGAADRRHQSHRRHRQKHRGRPGLLPVQHVFHPAGGVVLAEGQARGGPAVLGKGHQ